MTKRFVRFFAAALFGTGAAGAVFAEDIRLHIADTIEVSKDKTAGGALQLGFSDSAAIFLDRDTRFLRGVELEITAPQLWLAHHGSLAVALYAAPSKNPVKGNMELEARQLRTDVLANRIQTVYQIPVRKNHQFRNSPYTTLLSPALPSEFPLILRIMPLVKEVGDEVENMRFQVNVKPVLSDEGAARVNIKYPPNLQNKPWTMFIDDKIVEPTQDELVFREGSHHLLLISNDYRNESRRFMVERGKTIELNINLQDLTPFLIFEAPDNARIFLDNARVSQVNVPRPVEAGTHEVKVLVSDYTIIKTVFVQKGKTYRISFTVDLSVLEED